MVDGTGLFNSENNASQYLIKTSMKTALIFIDLSIPRTVYAVVVGSKKRVNAVTLLRGALEPSLQFMCEIALPCWGAMTDALKANYTLWETSPPLNAHLKKKIKKNRKIIIINLLSV